MTVLIPPGDQPIPDGHYLPPNNLVTLTMQKGDELVAHIESASIAPGAHTDGFHVFCVRSGSFNGPALFDPLGTWAMGPATFRYTAATTEVVYVNLFVGGSPIGPSTSTAHGYSIEFNAATIAYCQFGTELKTPGQFVYYLTPGLIDLALAELGLAWMAPLFTAWWFTTFDAQNLCSDGPPVPPPTDSTIWTAGLEERFEWLRAILWNYFCQCKPGTPAPTPFPPPTTTQPPGGPTSPTFPCDPSQLCSTLTQIQQQLAAISQTVYQDYALDTIVQRYQSPFAVIHGAVHSNVASSGTFAISRLIGVQVEVQAAPTFNQQFSGVPPYISDLGWLSILTGDGLIDEIRLTRSLQIWLPRLMPLATQFGISLREGVVVRITELEAEP